MWRKSSYTFTIGKPKKKYGILRFLLDLVLVVLTGGLWLVWMIFKFLRRG